MPPKIVLIRHAQALHNVTKDYSIHDPPLSEHGVKQCAGLRENLQARFSSAQDVAIIASPMRRTLQTTFLALDWLIERGVKVQPDPDWQENSAKPCDTGSPASSLVADFPQVDFSSMDSIWPDKTSQLATKYSYSRQAILDRGKRCIESLYSRPEQVVFVVSHSGFLRLGVVGWWFFNSDYRIFTFNEGPGELRQRLDQDKDTITGGLGLSRTERVELGFEIPEEDSTALEEGIDNA